MKQRQRTELDDILVDEVTHNVCERVIQYKHHDDARQQIDDYNKLVCLLMNAKTNLFIAKRKGIGGAKQLEEHVTGMISDIQSNIYDIQKCLEEN